MWSLVFVAKTHTATRTKRPNEARDVDTMSDRITKILIRDTSKQGLWSSVLIAGGVLTLSLLVIAMTQVGSSSSLEFLSPLSFGPLKDYFIKPDDHLNFCVIFGAFLLAGAIKGVIGLGITTVPVGLLTAVLNLETAMALVVFPAFFANLWQASTGGHAKMLISRLWPFLVCACVTIPLGAQALEAASVHVLSALLGVILVIYSVIGLVGLRLTISAKSETWSGPTMGAANGVLTGMTGSFIFPGVVFLQGLGLGRDGLIQGMGMLFTVSTVGLAFALNERAIMTTELASFSIIALLPATIGLFAGQRLRRILSEAQFRAFFQVALIFLGTYVAVAAVL